MSLPDTFLTALSVPLSNTAQWVLIVGFVWLILGFFGWAIVRGGAVRMVRDDGGEHRGFAGAEEGQDFSHHGECQ